MVLAKMISLGGGVQNGSGIQGLFVVSGSTVDAFQSTSYIADTMLVTYVFVLFVTNAKCAEEQHYLIEIHKTYR